MYVAYGFSESEAYCEVLSHSVGRWKARTVGLAHEPLTYQLDGGLIDVHDAVRAEKLDETHGLERRTLLMVDGVAPCRACETGGHHHGHARCFGRHVPTTEQPHS